MYKIVAKQVLNPTVVRMEIQAPYVAKKAQAGQFVILRVDNRGERIPLTVADYNRTAGTVTIIFQLVGATTKQLARLEVGDSLQDFVGPLAIQPKSPATARWLWLAVAWAAPLRTRWPRRCTRTAPRCTALWASVLRIW